MILTSLEKIYKREQFNPTFISIFFNPYYFARKSLFLNIKSLLPIFRGRVIDIGCGQKPYEAFFQDCEYIGLELDTLENRKNKKADVYYNGKSLPFGDKSFRCAITSQVFEHVFNPNTFLKEINRCLEQEGYLLITVPFIWDEHEQPNDFARYSSFGITHLLQEFGFEVLELRKSLKDIRLIFQLTNAYLAKTINPKNNFLRVFLHAMAVFPCNLMGTFLYKFFPSNPDLYLDNVVLAKKVRDA